MAILFPSLRIARLRRPGQQLVRGRRVFVVVQPIPEQPRGTDRHVALLSVDLQKRDMAQANPGSMGP
jgi:hypothetical protein